MVYEQITLSQNIELFDLVLTSAGGEPTCLIVFPLKAYQLCLANGFSGPTITKSISSLYILMNTVNAVLLSVIPS